MAKAVQKPRKQKNGYKMPDPLPQGEILEDMAKKKWKLGPSIGKGGFGEIYSAQEYSSGSKTATKYPYVIKIEPHSNGPLFVEMHFYMRNAKPDDVETFRTSKKLPFLGMPKYMGSGSHEHKNQKYRFLVMEKFGSDIWKLFLENNRTFPASTVFKLGIQVLDVLEYIHSKGYVHADIKGANILLSTAANPPKHVYLVDFGLASHYSSTLKPDPKKAHNGTIEYTSRDAHLGVQTRRGDLEILAYNLVQWLGCKLPWENVSDPATVHKSKNEHMANIGKFIKTCFGSRKIPGAIEKFLNYVNSLDVGSAPDYSKLRKILQLGVESEGGTLSGPLQFDSKKSPSSKRKINDGDSKKRKEMTQNGTKPKQTRKNKKVKDEAMEFDDAGDDNGDINEDVKDTNSTNSIEEPMECNESDEGELNSSQILTSEMKRLKEKLEQKTTSNKKGKSVKVKDKNVDQKTEKRSNKTDVKDSKDRVETREVKHVGDNCMSLRKAKLVNYNEKLLQDRSFNDSDIVSASEDESSSYITIRRKNMKTEK